MLSSSVTGSEHILLPQSNLNIFHFFYPDKYYRYTHWACVGQYSPDISFLGTLATIDFTNLSEHNYSEQLTNTQPLGGMMKTMLPYRIIGGQSLLFRKLMSEWNTTCLPQLEYLLANHVESFKSQAEKVIQIF